MNNYDIQIFYILSFFAIFIFFIDITSYETVKCIKKNYNYNFWIISILLLHHFLQIFGNFSWLFQNKLILKIYVISIILYIIFLSFSDFKCFLTEKINEICNWDDSTLFNDIFKIIGLKKYNIWNDYLNYFYSIITVIYAIYKIYK